MLGYDRYFDAMNRLEERTPNLFIGGQCRDGISLPDCLKSGEKLARRVAEAAAKG